MSSWWQWETRWTKVTIIGGRLNRTPTAHITNTKRHIFLLLKFATGRIGLTNALKRSTAIVVNVSIATSLGMRIERTKAKCSPQTGRRIISEIRNDSVAIKFTMSVRARFNIKYSKVDRFSFVFRITMMTTRFAGMPSSARNPPAIAVPAGSSWTEPHVEWCDEGVLTFVECDYWRIAYMIKNKVKIISSWSSRDLLELVLIQCYYRRKSKLN